MLKTMKVCKAWADQKQCGITIGYNKGKDEGWNEGKIEGKIEGGIESIIKFARSLNMNKEDTILKLVEIAGLSKEQASIEVKNFKS